MIGHELDFILLGRSRNFGLKGIGGAPLDAITLYQLLSNIRMGIVKSCAFRWDKIICIKELFAS